MPYLIETIRHSTAHLMATAVLELFPGTKFGIGPVIENGFYYDFDLSSVLSTKASAAAEASAKEGLPRPLTPLDLLKIEKRMKEIIKRKEPFIRQEMPLEEAIKFFQEQKQNYKVELLKDLKERGTTIIKDEEKQELGEKPNIASLYRTGKFIDLCRGPHVATTADLAVFKLTKIAGAYWRGSEKNKMLTRVYGLAFATQAELNTHLKMLEEAEKRDHRKLGQELGLFIISPLVGSGLPIFTPKGTHIRGLLKKYLRDEQLKQGYQPVWSPHLGSVELYKKSGHWPYYKETMYPPIKIDDEEYILKPMNCPHHILIYKSEMHSYRDLPIRLSEFGTVYRYEKSGELTGLTRVRGITQDDAHLFTRPDQIEQEVTGVLKLTLMVCKKLGLKDFKARLSLRDPQLKEKYVGTDQVWQKAEEDLRQALKKNKMDFFEAKGEAAFYGPKIDFIIKDVIGREWQMGTIQLDYNLPERFDLEYTGQDGKKHRPVMIHRAPFGSLERFMAILIEHYAGAFPVWLSPVQVAIIPVGQKHIKLCQKLAKIFTREDLRVQTSDANETVGYKIRQAEKQKIPYMLVIGDKEAKLKNLAVRERGQEKTKKMTVKKFLEMTKKRIEQKK